MSVEYERGDVVEAADPFDDRNASRPFVIISTDDHPFHGDQYIALTLTTRTWYEETIRVADEDFADGSLPVESFVVPWGIGSPQDGDIETYLGRLSAAIVDDAVNAMCEYVFANPKSE